MKNSAEKLLPEKYIAIINSKCSGYTPVLDLTKPLVCVVIPAFGESKFIKKTLDNFFKKQTYKDNLCVFVVYKTANEKDNTKEIITKYAVSNHNYNLYGIDENEFPDKTCIGHARAIGFSLAISVGLNNGFKMEDIILISSDADLMDIDPNYLKKITGEFRLKSTSVVGCLNKFTDESNNNLLIKTLKVIDDGFFINQFHTMGVLNGRCYAMRASGYSKTGGVDYKVQFDDIIFGVNTGKALGLECYKWIDSYVITSDRRYHESIKSTSLMDKYLTHNPLGVDKPYEAKVEHIPDLEDFYKKHFNEGFNVLAYYAAKLSYEDIEFIKNQFIKYIEYINTNLKHLQISDFNIEYAVELFQKYKSDVGIENWWKNEFTFKIEPNLDNSYISHFLTGALKKATINFNKITKVNQLSPPADNYNKIYLTKSATNSLLVKLYTLGQAAMGEEELLDTVYDLILHKQVAKVVPRLGPARNLLYFSQGTDTYFNKKMLINSFIEGDTLDKYHNNVKKITEALTLTLAQMFELYTKFGFSSDFGFIPVLEKLPLDETAKTNLIQHFNKFYKNENYVEFISKFFINDIIREGTQGNRGKLIEAINWYKSQIKVPKKYVLVHADLKPKNIIVNKENVIPIDWSRAHYNDATLDVSDILVSILVYTGSSELCNDIYIKTYQTLKELNTNVEQSLKFFMSFKLYSIARVFYKENLQLCETKLIESQKSDMYGFFKINNWVFKKYF